MIQTLFKLLVYFLRKNILINQYFNGYYLIKIPKDAAYPFLFFDFKNSTKIFSVYENFGINTSLQLKLYSSDGDFIRINEVMASISEMLIHCILNDQKTKNIINNHNIRINNVSNKNDYFVIFDIKILTFFYENY